MEQNAQNPTALTPNPKLELAEQLKNRSPSDSLFSQLTGNPFFTAVSIFVSFQQQRYN